MGAKSFHSRRSHPPNELPNTLTEGCFVVAGFRFRQKEPCPRNATMRRICYIAVCLLGLVLALPLSAAAGRSATPLPLPGRPTQMLLVPRMPRLISLICRSSCGRATQTKRTFRVESWPDGSVKIYVMNPDGSGQTPSAETTRTVSLRGRLMRNNSASGLLARPRGFMPWPGTAHSGGP